MCLQSTPHTSLVLLAGMNGQQEQQANGTLLQSSTQQQHPHTPPSAKSSSRLGLPQDQQQRQGTPPGQQQQQSSSQVMLLDLEQHPGLKNLLALLQADKFGGKEAAAVLADGQTAATVLEVGDTGFDAQLQRHAAPCRGSLRVHHRGFDPRKDCFSMVWRDIVMFDQATLPLAQLTGLQLVATARRPVLSTRPLSLTLPFAVAVSLLQVLCPPQADGTSSSSLQAWLGCSQLPWLLQAAGALLAHAEGRSEAAELQVGELLSAAQCDLCLF